MPTVLLLVLVLTFVPGCTQELGDIRQSRGEFFQELAAPVCDRLDTCGLMPPSGSRGCTAGFVAGACTLDQCEDVITMSAAEWQDCLDSYQYQSCSEMRYHVYPRYCTDLSQL